MDVHGGYGSKLVTVVAAEVVVGVEWLRGADPPSAQLPRDDT